MPPRRFRLMEIGIVPAETSEIVGVVSIFLAAFKLENPKLAQLLYASSDPVRAKIAQVVHDILRTQMHFECGSFMIAYDATKGLSPKLGVGFDPEEDLNKDVSYGWVSVGMVSHGSKVNSYAASDLFSYASLKLIAREARDRGEDPRQLSTDNLCVRLARELTIRSREGQALYLLKPYLVVNTLAIWPDSYSGSTWEMATELLQWVVNDAARSGSSIWTQIPVGQARFFREAGFREVKAFTLNLNDYAPPGGTDMGTQEWVQMAFNAPRERRARSVSPGNRGGRPRTRALSGVHRTAEVVDG